MARDAMLHDRNRNQHDKNYVIQSKNFLEITPISYDEIDIIKKILKNYSLLQLYTNKKKE